MPSTTDRSLAVPTPSPSGPVHGERVVFRSAEAELVGTLYRPAGDTVTRPRPAVVVTGAWMTIKEQMAGRYARALAETGVLALAFDFRGWGQSGGSPRALEDPQRKTADIIAAARYLAGRDDVASVGVLGICASAGYAALAATRSEAIASIALVAPWVHDAEIVDAVYGGREGVRALIAAGQQAHATYEATGTATMVPAAGPAGSSAVMAGVPYYTEAARGAIPAWENRFNVASWEPWLTFDGIAVAPAVRQPLCLVHSEAAAIPQGAQRFFAALPGDKRQLWLDGVTQFDFYDGDAAVRQAVATVAEHFRQTLPAIRRMPAVATAARTVDEAKVIAVVSSIPLAVDLGDYGLAEAAFAPAIRIDYTSLWGGAPQETTPAALMAAWRGIVPGFDATRHALADVQATVDGDDATASAAVDGRHWLDGAVWRPIGRYNWSLVRVGGRWVVTAMTFVLEREEGARTLAEEAMTRAARRAG